MTWAFDIDGTLVGSIRSEVLRPGATELLASLAERGIPVVVWSAGGADYARRMVERHGLQRYVAAEYAKEGRDDAGRYRHDHFRPEHHPAAFVDDVPLDMPVGAYVIRVSQFMGGNLGDAVLDELSRDLDRHVAAAQQVVLNLGRPDIDDAQ